MGFGCLLGLFRPLFIKFNCEQHGLAQLLALESRIVVNFVVFVFILHAFSLKCAREYVPKRCSTSSRIVNLVDFGLVLCCFRLFSREFTMKIS